jgi:hypothetical protein
MAGMLDQRAGLLASPQGNGLLAPMIGPPQERPVEFPYHPDERLFEALDSPENARKLFAAYVESQQGRFPGTTMAPGIDPETGGDREQMARDFAAMLVDRPNMHRANRREEQRYYPGDILMARDRGSWLYQSLLRGDDI